MRRERKSQGKNELTSIIVDVNEKKSVWAKFAHTEKEWVAQKMR